MTEGGNADELSTDGRTGMDNAEKFKKDRDFELLNPKYKVTPEEIRDYIIDRYKKEFEKPLP